MTLPLFWIAFALVVYAYVGFPLLIWLRSRLVRRPWMTADECPSITLVIACHNEARGIRAKLENVRELDYPRDRLQVLIASDGSTDDTESIAAEYEDECLTLLRLPRTGKAGALNASISLANGEILVFSDANSLLATDALRKLVRHFADPTIGCVAGNQCYQRSQTRGATDSGERGYWNLDRLMKIWQSVSGNATSATGAIYALRASLFRTVPEGVTDDFVTSTRAVAQGFRLVFDVEAKCYEPVAAKVGSEFRRKTRVITRGLNAAWTMRKLMNPRRHGFYAIQIASHKVLRRLVVLPLILMAITTPLLWNASVGYRVFAVLQAAFYAAAVCGWLWSRRTERVPNILGVPLYFCMVNLAVLVAVKNVICGNRITVWNPRRESDSISDEPTQAMPESEPTTQELEEIAV